MNAAARLRLCLLASMLMTGCGHGAAPILPGAASGSSASELGRATVSATFRISVPSGIAFASSPALRHQAFVAASTRSAMVDAYAAGKMKKPVASLVVDLSAKSHDCRKLAARRACTIVLAVGKPAKYDFLVRTYDRRPRGGRIPSSAKQLAAGIAASDLTKSRAVKIVLGGVVASTSVATTATTFPAIDPVALSLTVEALDADGNVIVSDGYVGSNGKPLTVTMSADSAAGSTISFSPASFTAPPANVTLTYAPGAMNATQAQNGFATAISAPASDGAPSAGFTLTLDAPHVTLYPITTSGSMPQYITTGPDGALWFTEYNANQIGRITTAGVVTNEYSAGPSGTGPRKIVSGPDGNLWFTAQSGNSVSKMDASGNVSSFTITTPNSYPESIAAGSDGNMWFTEEGTNRIGRLNTGLTGFSEFSLGGAPKPYGITSGADGALWFADYGSSQIDRITTSGTVMAVPYSTAPSTLPFVIVSGSDGDLWFGGCSNYLGRMTSGGALTTYAIPNGGEVSDLTVGPDGAVWFSVTTVPTQIQSIGRMSTSGVMTLYPIEATPSNPYPSGITKGPDGAIWFLELNANQVGRLQ